MSNDLIEPNRVPIVANEYSADEISAEDNGKDAVRRKSNVVRSRQRMLSSDGNRIMYDFLERNIAFSLSFRNLKEEEDSRTRATAAF